MDHKFVVQIEEIKHNQVAIKREKPMGSDSDGKSSTSIKRNRKPNSQLTTVIELNLHASMRFENVNSNRGRETEKDHLVFVIVSCCRVR